MVLRRDLSYDLFSREPEDWAEWAGFARDHYTAKREPSPYQSDSGIKKLLQLFLPPVPNRPVHKHRPT